MALLEKIGAVRYNVTQWDPVKQFWVETIGCPIAWASDEAGWAEFEPEDGCRMAIERATAGRPVAGGDHGILVDSK